MHGLGCDAEPAAPPRTGGGRDRVLTLEGVVPGAPASLGASLARARLRGEGPGGRGLASFALGGARVFAAPPGGATALLATEDRLARRAALLGRVGAPPGAYGARRDGSLAALVESSEDSRVYVCGDGGGMARDVHAALVDALAKHAFAGDEAKAAEKLAEMTKQGRYVRDIWS